MEKYFSSHQVAKMCQVTRGSVIRWIHEGKLNAALTAGGHHRVQAEDLYQLLKNLKMTVPEDLQNLVKREGPPRILVVDDEPNVRQMLRGLLQKNFPECTLVEAADGFEAGLRVIDFKPDLILLDLMLPGADGFRVCGQIRSQRELDHTKIIVITGLQDESTRDRILKLGADDFLTKPFNLADLEGKIRHHLDQTRRESQTLEGDKLL